MTKEERIKAGFTGKKTVIDVETGEKHTVDFDDKEAHTFMTVKEMMFLAERQFKAAQKGFSEFTKEEMKLYSEFTKDENDNDNF